MHNVAIRMYDPIPNHEVQRLFSTLYKYMERTMCTFLAYNDPTNSQRLLQDEKDDAKIFPLVMRTKHEFITSRKEYFLSVNPKIRSIQDPHIKQVSIYNDDNNNNLHSMLFAFL